MMSQVTLSRRRATASTSPPLTTLAKAIGSRYGVWQSRPESPEEFRAQMEIQTDGEISAQNNSIYSSSGRVTSVDGPLGNAFLNLLDLYMHGDDEEAMALPSPSIRLRSSSLFPIAGYFFCAVLRDPSTGDLGEPFFICMSSPATTFQGAGALFADIFDTSSAPWLEKLESFAPVVGHFEMYTRRSIWIRAQSL